MCPPLRTFPLGHQVPTFNEKAYNVLKILEQFQPPKTGEGKVAEGDGAAPDNGGASKTGEFNPYQQAALDIDQLYRQDEWASAYWQEKTEARKKLRQKVRRIVNQLSLVDAKEVSNAIDAYAVRHYAKP